MMGIAVYGMVWLPNLYMRLHAASKAAVLGVIPILLAISLDSEIAVAARSILILVFLLLTTPVGAHAMARAIYHRDGWAKGAPPVPQEPPPEYEEDHT
jgi:multicomponent Na+:H+ antiporter subunit G